MSLQTSFLRNFTFTVLTLLIFSLWACTSSTSSPVATSATTTKYYVGGAFTTYNGITASRIARLNYDGSLDTTFSPTGTGLSSTVRKISVDSIGRVLVGGLFTTYNGGATAHLARLNLDGSLDSTFALTGTGFDNNVYSAIYNASGNPVVMGSFTNYNGGLVSKLARLHPDGSLDGTFAQTGTGINFQTNSGAFDGSGKIIVGGYLTGYNGTNELYVVRVNANGTLDTTFAPVGSGLNNDVQIVVLDAAGKILVGGDFTSYNGTAEPYAARLNTDGSLDTSFTQTGTGLNGTVSGIALTSTGKIIVGGSFTSYNGVTAPYLARLNADGTLDTTFSQTGLGLNGAVYKIAIDPSGKLLVAGAFTTYNGAPAPSIVRLNADGSLDTTFSSSGTGLNNYVSAVTIYSVTK